MTATLRYAPSMGAEIVVSGLDDTNNTLSISFPSNETNNVVLAEWSEKIRARNCGVFFTGHPVYPVETSILAGLDTKSNHINSTVSGIVIGEHKEIEGQAS